jgi:predicted patatin/cPLA2 family phospholipase
VNPIANQYAPDGKFRILTLDGGGAKGFYTLGVLAEIEGMLKCPLYKRFDLIFGTSTGAIIAALLALGYEVEKIHQLYKDHVPNIMSRCTAAGKTAALRSLVHQVFEEKKFTDVPMIFKGSVSQAHGREGTFVPGFGVKIADAVEASCSAYPYFERKMITTSQGDEVELIDGGFCANNPTLYALADAISALKKNPADIRVVNVGVGVYPQPKSNFIIEYIKKFYIIELLQKTLEINTQSMEQLRAVLFKDVPAVRISEKFDRPEMATDLMEHDLKKLNLLRQRGRDSFADNEKLLREFLLENVNGNT